MYDWLQIALRRDVFVRGVKVAGLVGTALVAINQGDLIVRGELRWDAAWKIPLTYLVPYLVSTYAGVSAIRAARDDAAN